MTDLNSRYGMNPPHSEVVSACQTIAPCNALDMGCGSGRNALYLSQLGFEVTAVDTSPNALGMLQSIVEQEGITTLTPNCTTSTAPAWMTTTVLLPAPSP